jgi:hypothetical protein
LQYFEYEFPLPKNGNEHVALFPFYFNFRWLNAIESEPISVDLKHFLFNFNEGEKIRGIKNYDAKATEIFAEFPLIEDWGGFMDYKFKLYGINFAGTL